MTVTFTDGRAVSAWELNRMSGAIDGTYIFPSTAGGVVTPSSGLTVAVSAISASLVTINNALVSTGYAGGTVTASAADPTNPRRDLVYYDTSGAVGILTGTPAALTTTTGPVLPTPSATQTAVAELYITAGLTTIASGNIADKRQSRLSSGGPAVPNLSTMTGDPTFPYYGNVATTRTDAANATITDSTYPGKVIQLSTWTINAGVVMTMQGGPWFIFVNTLSFGNTSSQISGDGPTTTSSTSAQYARGGVVNTTHIAGGCGGVMLFLCIGTTNTAAGKITANGGAGVADTTNQGANRASEGQGALSTRAPALDSGTSRQPQVWAADNLYAPTAAATYTTPHQMSNQLLALGLGRGGKLSSVTWEANPNESRLGGTGGGSGGTAGNIGTGGSGIGSGGYADAAGTTGTAASLPANPASPLMLLELARVGCLGGGGGGAGAAVGSVNAGAGGGGGSILAYVRTLTTTPSLSVSAGAGATNSTGATSAATAGQSYLVTVP